MTYVTGGGAQNTFDIVHNQNDDDPVTNLENITVIGGPGAGATDTLVLDRVLSSSTAPDSVTLSAGSETLGVYSYEGVEVTGTDTSIFDDGVYAISVNMYGGTLDVNDLSSAGSYNISVQGIQSPSRDPNHIIIEPPQNNYADDVSVDTGLTIDDQATDTDYMITRLVAQDNNNDVRIKFARIWLRDRPRYPEHRPVHAHLRLVFTLAERQYPLDPDGCIQLLCDGGH